MMTAFDTAKLFSVRQIPLKYQFGVLLTTSSSQVFSNDSLKYSTESTRVFSKSSPNTMNSDEMTFAPNSIQEAQRQIPL